MSGLNAFVSGATEGLDAGLKLGTAYSAGKEKRRQRKSEKALLEALRIARVDPTQPDGPDTPGVGAAPQPQQAIAAPNTIPERPVATVPSAGPAPGLTVEGLEKGPATHPAPVPASAAIPSAAPAQPPAATSSITGEGRAAKPPSNRTDYANRLDAAEDYLFSQVQGGNITKADFATAHEQLGLIRQQGFLRNGVAALHAFDGGDPQAAAKLVERAYGFFPTPVSINAEADTAPDGTPLISIVSYSEETGDPLDVSNGKPTNAPKPLVLTRDLLQTMIDDFSSVELWSTYTKGKSSDPYKQRLYQQELETERSESRKKKAEASKAEAESEVFRDQAEATLAATEALTAQRLASAGSSNRANRPETETGEKGAKRRREKDFNDFATKRAQERYMNPAMRDLYAQSGSAIEAGAAGLHGLGLTAAEAFEIAETAARNGLVLRGGNLEAVPGAQVDPAMRQQIQMYLDRALRGTGAVGEAAEAEARKADVKGAANLPEPKTKAEYDALPSGAQYLDNGVIYTKK